MNNVHLAVQFFIQLAVILLFCRIVGAIAGRLGQPQVVAEMLAGVLLGPSLFGLLWPEAQHWLFPWDTAQKMRDTQSYLFPASQLGLALYMFVVGMEFRVDIVRRKLTSSIAVSVAGMVTPFVLGAGLAWILFDHTTLFPKNDFALGGDAFSWRIHVYHRVSDARADHSFQETYRHNHGHGGVGRRGNRRCNGMVSARGGTREFREKLEPRPRQHRRWRCLRGRNAVNRPTVAASCQSLAGKKRNAHRSWVGRRSGTHGAGCVVHRSHRFARGVRRICHGCGDAARGCRAR